MYTFILLFILMQIVLADADNCKGGSKHWCQSVDKATECGVYNFCKLTVPGFGKPIKQTNNNSPVMIELYYESFCGGCRMFILQQLAPTFKLLQNTGIMNVALYPYGNAYESQDGDRWKFNCQHGERECQVNLLETCALHMMPKPSQFLPFIECVETTPGVATGQQCADQYKVDWSTLVVCMNGTLGNQLEHEMAVKTDALQPRHTYVPWIVVNGNHNNEIQEDASLDLLNFICKTYQGEKPEQCNSSKIQKCNRT